MATTYRIVVTVDPNRAVRGSSRVSGSLDKTTAAANRLRGALQGAFVVAGIAATVRGLINMTNTYTNLQNRLRLVTTGTQNLADTTSALFEVANRTRSSYESTAELFARVSLSVKDLGVSQQQTLQFTESLNQAVILSGATAREAKAGIIQLSQGLASGALRGDELRSVLEQLPKVADVIAKEMKVTRGELRLMGEQGKISAEIVLEAFKNARGELADKFSKVVFTVAQEWERFNNKLLQSIGALDATTGASFALAQIIGFLADNMSTIIPVIGSIAFLIGVKLATIAIPAAIAAIKSLTVALLFNPFGAIALAVVAFIAILSQFEEEFKIVKDAVVAALKALWDAFKKYFGQILEFVKETVENIKFLMLAMAHGAEEAARRVKKAAKDATKVALEEKRKQDAINALSSVSTGSRGRPGSGTRTPGGGSSTGDRGIAGGSTFTTGGDIFGGSTFTKRTPDIRGTFNQPSGTVFDLSKSGNFNSQFPGGGGTSFPGTAFTKLADGGEIKIGGEAGIDRNTLSVNDRVVAKVGRGETIEVKPNKKPDMEDTKREGDNINIHMNISTPDADSFLRSRGQIQAKVQAAQERASKRNN